MHAAKLLGLSLEEDHSLFHLRFVERNGIYTVSYENLFGYCDQKINALLVYSNLLKRGRTGPQLMNKIDQSMERVIHIISSIVDNLNIVFTQDSDIHKEQLRKLLTMLKGLDRSKWESFEKLDLAYKRIHPKFKRQSQH